MLIISSRMQESTDTLFQMRFPQKLWHLLKLGSEAILWGGNGQTILINYKMLDSYLRTDHSIFKTTNISSFIRQLNLYGFRKVTSHLQDPLCNSSNPFMHEYMHDYFQYGRPDLLKNISRKPLNIKPTLKTKRCNVPDQTFTPLQKARHALRVALNKAVANYYLNNNTMTKIYKTEFKGAEEVCENNDIDMNMFKPKNIEVIPKTDAIKVKYESGYSWCYDSSDCQPNSNEVDAVCMPYVEVRSYHDAAKMELLAEFNVNKNTSLFNCISPSSGVYNLDDNAVNENYNENYFHGEWEQMLNDIDANKHSFYSQISMASDVLNSENIC